MSSLVLICNFQLVFTGKVTICYNTICFRSIILWRWLLWGIIVVIVVEGDFFLNILLLVLGMLIF